MPVEKLMSKGIKSTRNCFTSVSSVSKTTLMYVLFSWCGTQRRESSESQETEEPIERHPRVQPCERAFSGPSIRMAESPIKEQTVETRSRWPPR